MSISQPAVFSALADPTRLTIIDLLAQRGALPASQISRVFSLTPSAISQHLKVLREAGVVRVERRAQSRIYYLETEAILQTQDWLASRVRQWDARLDAMETYIANLADRDEGDPE